VFVNLHFVAPHSKHLHVYLYTTVVPVYTNCFSCFQVHLSQPLLPGNKKKHIPWTLVLRYPFDPKANAFARSVKSIHLGNDLGSSSVSSSSGRPLGANTGSKGAINVDDDDDNDDDDVSGKVNKVKSSTIRAMAFGRRREADKTAPHVANRYTQDDSIVLWIAYSCVTRKGKEP